MHDAFRSVMFSWTICDPATYAQQMLWPLICWSMEAAVKVMATEVGVREPAVHGAFNAPHQCYEVVELQLRWPRAHEGAATSLQVVVPTLSRSG